MTPTDTQDELGGRLSAEQRIALLCDPGSLRWHVPESRSSRVIYACGRVSGRKVVCYAYEARHAAGAIGTAEANSVVSALSLALHSRSPIVGFMESSGARLQEGIGALAGFGRIFRSNVALSGRVPQISVITGTSAGGGCYSPALTDFVVMTEAAAMFLTGPDVVKQALGEDVSRTMLGGARVHGSNGVCHLVAADEIEAVAAVRNLLGYLPDHALASPPRAPVRPPPRRDPSEVVPVEGRRVYDVRTVISAVVDDGQFFELCARWARNLVVGFAHLEGRAVGIIANQPHHLGGVLDAAASQKGARFVRTCSRYRLPILVFVDTPGFMPGARQESAAVIQHGADLVRAFVESSVPRITVILRKAYGGAYIAMNSYELGAHLTLAWPNAEIGVMGPRAAAQILHRRRLKTAVDSASLESELAIQYARDHIGSRQALELGQLDAIIAPTSTRAALVSGLRSADSSPAWAESAGSL